MGIEKSSKTLARPKFVWASRGMRDEAVARSSGFRSTSRVRGRRSLVVPRSSAGADAGWMPPAPTGSRRPPRPPLGPCRPSAAAGLRAPPGTRRTRRQHSPLVSTRSSHPLGSGLGSAERAHGKDEPAAGRHPNSAVSWKPRARHVTVESEQQLEYAPGTV